MESVEKEDKVYKKEKIPAAVRTAVWNTYVGPDLRTTKCYVGCGEIISCANFECGHIHAEAVGGETTISNLRPICSLCNKSMGKKNMHDFILQYKFDSPLIPEISGGKSPKIVLAKPIKTSKKVNTDTWDGISAAELRFALNYLSEKNKWKINMEKNKLKKDIKATLDKKIKYSDYVKLCISDHTKKEIIEKFPKETKDIADKSKKIIVESLVDDLVSRKFEFNSFVADPTITTQKTKPCTIC